MTCKEHSTSQSVSKQNTLLTGNAGFTLGQVGNGSYLSDVWLTT